MKAAILGMGEWRPETVRDNSAWPTDFGARTTAHQDMSAYLDFRPDGGSDLYDAITARLLGPEVGDPFAGTVHRRVADNEVTSCEAESRAARVALADARVQAGDIDYILSWAGVPDRITPPSAPRVGHLLGATRAIGIGMEMACATLVGQLSFAASLIESGRARNVLITGSHLATRAFSFLHPASPGFGDAATAVVVGPSERSGILGTFGVSLGNYYDTVAWRRSEKSDTPWYEAGGPMYLGSYDRDGFVAILRSTIRFGHETVTEAARRSGVAVSDIDVLASVQPRRWVPIGIAEALGLSPDRAPQTYDELANLGTCGIVANLLEARRRGLLNPRPGGEPATVAIYAQGAGFTRGAVIVRWVA
jgi:3-oxoacyl-[acyl-carrier-protein] synthase-3